MEQEPLGEERDDLRIGALASVILNMNAERTGGIVRPQKYISGWGDDRIYVMAIKPPELEASQTENSSSLNLSDPIVWENFATGLMKMHYRGPT